ncbi:MAG: PDZ domain-containing protein [Bacteroidaceae bacterium]|nr:PDZ domain-containing protein [Bacteroidaceae bacterium]
MNKHRITPFLMAVCIVLGVFIGTFYASHYSGNRLNIINTGSNKLNYLLQLIDNNYVDTVDMTSLVEDAMPQILSELDPHSSYISANNAQEASENLKGSFSGIGVSFTMEKDTVNVMSVIHGGPAEKVGILAGDRIVTADKTSLVGMESNNVMKHLKGEKGSKVKLGIRRHGSKQIQYFTVVRGDIPVVSVDASYMINNNTGYIRVKNFGEQTYAEMLVALANLNMSGMKNLIIDLRGNQGGYMHIAIQMANEFLHKNQLVVYTQGRKSPREEYRSDGRGTFQRLPLVVLVDEGSASASEIFAGAIQDNDRGTIIGRRSFGKGLVQQPMEFRDGSVVRLTIARYYTPSGRCIQKPYEKGHGEEYENDLLARYERGEFFYQDSIHQDGEKYYTNLGRVVYGGGGIMPDIFIPEDTSAVTSYYKEAVFTGLIRQFAFAYTDENRSRLNALASVEATERFLRGENLIERFARFAEEHDLKRRNLMLQKSRALFERNIFGNIIYNAREMQDYLQFLNEDDPTVQHAIQVLSDGLSYPQAPEPESEDSTKKGKELAKGNLPEHLLLPVHHMYAVAS